MWAWSREGGRKGRRKGLRNDRWVIFDSPNDATPFIKDQVREENQGGTRRLSRPSCLFVCLFACLFSCSSSSSCVCEAPWPEQAWAAPWLALSRPASTALPSMAAASASHPLSLPLRLSLETDRQGRPFCNHRAPACPTHTPPPAPTHLSPSPRQLMFHAPLAFRLCAAAVLGNPRV